MLSTQTRSIKPAEVKKDWVLIDAEGLVLGRLAALCAASTGKPHLAIIPSGPWRDAPPVPGRPLTTGAEV